MFLREGVYFTKKLNHYRDIANHNIGCAVLFTHITRRYFFQKKDVELGKLAVYHTLQQPGPDTVLIGMNNRQILNYNLDVLYNGISPKEHEVYNDVMK